TPSLAFEVLLVRVHELREGHSRNHRCVPDGLQLHIAAILGALELDDDEICLLVNAEQVNSSCAVDPSVKLLADHHQAWIKRLNLIAQQSLKVFSLKNIFRRQLRCSQRN